jgi:hypothetical protein
MNNKVTCEGCGHSGNPSQEAFYQLVTGWRRMFPTTQALAAKRPEQRYACRSCVQAFDRSGERWMQPSLFETPA